MSGEHAVGSTGSVGERPRTEVGITLHVLSWRRAVTETVDAATTVLKAYGWLSQSNRRWRDPRLICAEGIPLDLIDCYVEILCRTKDAVPGSNIGDEEPSASLNVPATGWIGWWRSDNEPETTPADMKLLIGSDLFGELVVRHQNGLPMPGELDFVIADLTISRAVPSGLPGLQAELAGPDRPIVSVGWEYRPERSPSLAEDAIPAAVRRWTAAIDWKRDGWRFRHWQYRNVVGELMASAVRTVVDGGMLAEDLDVRLREASELAESLYDILLRGERQRRADLRQLKVKVEVDDGPQGIPWTKRKPQFDFTEGVRSFCWSGVGKTDLTELADQYLASGFSGPTIEVVLVDAMVYAEVREFGESIKQRRGGALDLGSDYQETGGNVARMTGRRSLRRLPLSLFNGIVWYLLPAFLMVVAVSEGHLEKAMMTVAGWAAAVIAWPHFVRGLGFGGGDKPAQVERHGDLLLEMGNAYAAFDPGLPPGVVRRHIERAAEKGAVWDVQVYAMLARAEARNPAAWAEDRPTAGLARTIAKHIDDARQRAEKSMEFEMPDFDRDPKTY